MNIKENYRFIGNEDISALKDYIEIMPEDEWTRDSWRQEKYKVHQWTQTISLAFDMDFRHANPTIHPIYDQFQDMLKPLVKKIHAFYVKEYPALPEAENSYFIRINLVKLLAHGSIPAHNDKNFSLTHSHRIHIPIISNSKVEFVVNNEVKVMKEGEMWEINNKKIHFVENKSELDRVHIIMDWVIPGERCCCGIKYRPNVTCSPESCLSTDRSPIVCECLS